MRLRYFAFLGALFVAGSCSVATTLGLCPCTPDNCGGRSQNQATVRSFTSRIETSFNPGELHVHVGDLQDLNGQPIAYKVFKVYDGQLTNHIASVSYLGSITVAHRISDGPIWRADRVASRRPRCEGRAQAQGAALQPTDR
jgi:hypothetical protein